MQGHTYTLDPAPPFSRAMGGVTVQTNFLRDLRFLLRNRLKELGYDLDRTPTLPKQALDRMGPTERACLTYLNLLWRRIPTRRRRVHLSKQLAARQLPHNLRACVDVIKTRALRGEPLWPFQSTHLDVPLSSD